MVELRSSMRPLANRNRGHKAHPTTASGFSDVGPRSFLMASGRRGDDAVVMPGWCQPQGATRLITAWFRWGFDP